MSFLVKSLLTSHKQTAKHRDKVASMGINEKYKMYQCEICDVEFSSGWT